MYIKACKSKKLAQRKHIIKQMAYQNGLQRRCIIRWKRMKSIPRKLPDWNARNIYWFRTWRYFTKDLQIGN
jgi:hypothetical protein